jgi:hypothetical protein
MFELSCTFVLISRARELMLEFGCLLLLIHCSSIWSYFLSFILLFSAKILIVIWFGIYFKQPKAIFLSSHFYFLPPADTFVIQ